MVDIQEKLSEDRVGIARPNAIHVHIASQFGLLMVQDATASVTSIPGATTARVNLPLNAPHFEVGVDYILGGLLEEDGSYTPFSMHNAEFKGYGTGLLQNVGVFVGLIVAPN